MDVPGKPQLWLHRQRVLHPHEEGDPTPMGPSLRLAQVAFGEEMCWSGASFPCGIELELMSGAFNHVLKSISSSTHGCQHIVETRRRRRYDAPMQLDPRSISDRVVESGRAEALVGVTGEPAESLAVLEFADFLRRSAERLSQASAEAARHHGASWREIGQAVGGITRRVPNIGSALPPRNVDRRRRKLGGQG